MAETDSVAALVPGTFCRRSARLQSISGTRTYSIHRAEAAVPIPPAAPVAVELSPSSLLCVTRKQQEEEQQHGGEGKKQRLTYSESGSDTDTDTTTDTDSFSSVSLEEEEEVEERYKAPRSMTEDEWKRYSKQLKETGGFDMEDVPIHVDECGLIYPWHQFERPLLLYEELLKCSRKAIAHYNSEKKTNYQFLKIVKVCSRSVSGSEHYITFEAEAKAQSPVCFQALVYAPIGLDVDENKMFVHLVRPKQQSSS